MIVEKSTALYKVLSVQKCPNQTTQQTVRIVILCVIIKTTWLTKKLNIKFTITRIQLTFKEHDVPIWLTSLAVTLNSPEPYCLCNSADSKEILIQQQSLAPNPPCKWFHQK